MDTLEPLPPIPTPPAQRWKEFRVQFLPLIVFVLAVVAVCVLWNHTIQPMGVVGEVEITAAEVISPEDGSIIELTVDRFTKVEAGQVVGYTLRMDDEMKVAAEAILEAESSIESIRQTVAEGRRRLDVQQLKLDLQKERTDLASNTPRLLEASNRFVRAKELVEAQYGPISKADYDKDLAEFEALKATINSQKETIAELQQFIDATERGEPIDIIAAINAAKKAQLDELERTRRSPLICPISGVVNLVNKRAGERVLRGESVMLISAPESQRIVGYIKQPIVKRPTLGANVRVRTRTRPPMIGEAKILSIGGQIEPIKDTMLSGDATTAVASGLPILVSLPKNLPLLPGELVDLTIDYSKE